jgi:uncharacterized protein involved in exopolysaccharide biosynthesis
MNKQENQPQINAFVLTLLRKWPLLLVLGLFGALAGLGVSAIRKPQYEAEAAMGINIQYGVIEPLELVVEDRALNRVANFILADSTLLQVMENIPQAVRQEQGWDNPADLMQILRLDRGLSAWGFVVTHADPALAAEISNVWMEISLAELIEAQDHAWQVVALMGEEPFQLACDQYLVPSVTPGSYAWRCDLEPVSIDADALAGKLRTEIDLSHGILPIFSFEALNAAETPQSPVLYHRGVLVLCGAFIGLLVAIWIALALPRKHTE